MGDCAVKRHMPYYTWILPTISRSAMKLIIAVPWMYKTHSSCAPLMFFAPLPKSYSPNIPVVDVWSFFAVVCKRKENKTYLKRDRKPTLDTSYRQRYGEADPR